MDPILIVMAILLFVTLLLVAKTLDTVNDFSEKTKDLVARINKLSDFFVAKTMVENTNYCVNRFKYYSFDEIKHNIDRLEEKVNKINSKEKEEDQEIEKLTNALKNVFEKSMNKKIQVDIRLFDA